MKSPALARRMRTLSAAAVIVDTSASAISTERAVSPRKAGQSAGRISISPLGVASYRFLVTTEFPPPFAFWFEARIEVPGPVLIGVLCPQSYACAGRVVGLRGAAAPS